MKSAQLIRKLKREKQLYGTCPHCGNDFRICDATLFATDEFPQDALNRVTALKAGLKERQSYLKEMKNRITNRSRITAESVNLGKIVEKIAPSFETFQFSTRDCRTLLEPIDYLIFSGLHRKGVVESITFLEVKSGAARLTPMQREISAVVQRGNVDVNLVDAKEQEDVK